MKLKIKILYSLLAILALAGCGSMTELGLYEVMETQSYSPMDKFGATQIYTQGKTDENWQSPAENGPCLKVDWNYPSHPTGDGTCMYVKWDRVNGGCDWVGLGFGWNKWQAKDLSNIIDHAALEVWIRTVKGSTSNVRFVFMFEDYAETNAASVINALGIDHEDKVIDTVWKRVIMPLSTFGFDAEGFDKQSIKQLKLECQSTGEFLLGPMTLIPHKTEYKKLEDGRVTYTMNSSEFSIFSDDIKSQWGIRPKFCDAFTYGTDNPKEGSQFISIRKTGECDWTEFGLNWSNWAPIDIKPIYESTALQFYIRGESPTGLVPMQFCFDTWTTGRSQTFEIDAKYIEGGKLTDKWSKVTIPLTDLKLTDKGVGIHAIKALVFKADINASVDIDDIRFTPYAGGGGNPFTRYVD